jgi:hypothetical protein
MMEEQVMDSPFLFLVFLIFLVAYVYLYDVFPRNKSNGKSNLLAKKRDSGLRSARGRDSA